MQDESQGTLQKQAALERVERDEQVRQFVNKEATQVLQEKWQDMMIDYKF